MRLVTRPQAEADLDAIFRYLWERNPTAAARVQETIGAQVRLLADQPGLGRPGRTSGTRELVITSTPYIVAYAVDQAHQTVYILRVLHGAQKWPEDFEEWS